MPSAPGNATALKGRDVGRRCGRHGQCSSLGRGRAGGPDRALSDCDKSCGMRGAGCERALLVFGGDAAMVGGLGVED